MKRGRPCVKILSHFTDFFLIHPSIDEGAKKAIIQIKFTVSNCSKYVHLLNYKTNESTYVAIVMDYNLFYDQNKEE